jgi:hypothetical protein
VLYQAGADPYREDPYSPLALDPRRPAASAIPRFEWARAAAIPIAWVLAGGYTKGHVEGGARRTQHLRPRRWERCSAGEKRVGVSSSARRWYTPPTPMKQSQLATRLWDGHWWMVFFYLPIAILIGFSFNTSRLNIHLGGVHARMVRRHLARQPARRHAGEQLIVAVDHHRARRRPRHRRRLAAVPLPLPGRALWQTLIFIPMIIPEVIMGVSC